MYYKIIKTGLGGFKDFYLIDETPNDIEAYHWYQDGTSIAKDLNWAGLFSRILIIGEPYKELKSEFNTVAEVEKHFDKFPIWDKTPYYIRIYSKIKETIKFRYLYFLSTKTNSGVINPCTPDTNGFCAADIKNVANYISQQTGHFPNQDLNKLYVLTHYTDEACMNAWTDDKIESV
jgi:hypothetical protein